MKDKLEAVLRKYSRYPEYLGIDLVRPDQPGAFDDTLLHLTARTGAIDDLLVLIEAGANVNVIGDIGNTPLHGAAMKGRVESIRLLLDHGANPDITNEFKQTALEVAELGNHNSVVEILKPLTRK